MSTCVLFIHSSRREWDEWLECLSNRDLHICIDCYSFDQTSSTKKKEKENGLTTKLVSAQHLDHSELAKKKSDIHTHTVLEWLRMNKSAFNEHRLLCILIQSDRPISMKNNRSKTIWNKKKCKEKRNERTFKTHISTWFACTKLERDCIHVLVVDKWIGLSRLTWWVKTVEGIGWGKSSDGPSLSIKTLEFTWAETAFKSFVIEESEKIFICDPHSRPNWCRTQDADFRRKRVPGRRKRERKREWHRESS